MKTFDVKLYYTGYRIIRVEANDVHDAYDKAMDQAGEGLGISGPDNANLPKVQADFLATMRRDEDEDTLSEVGDLDSPVDEDRVTFGPTTFSDGKVFLVLDPDDLLFDKLIEKEG